jgi:hypothetical protein
MKKHSCNWDRSLNTKTTELFAGELAEDRSREVHGEQAEVPLQPEVQPEVYVQVSPQLHKVVFISAKFVRIIRALFNVFICQKISQKYS